MPGSVILAGRLVARVLATALLMSSATAAEAPTQVGTAPLAAALPRAEFVFEERVTLAPAVVLGETDLGRRQYIPITGGVIAGPKLKGEVIPGGWDFQLGYAGGCTSLTADYFLRAEDGTIIHVLNQAFNCPGGAPAGERNWTRPTFEAPKGSKYEWLTRGTFVGALEVEPPPANAAPGGAAQTPAAIRIKFYQIK